MHRHVIWSRIDAGSMTAISDSHNFARHAATSRELEKEFELKPVQNILHGPDGPRPQRRSKNWETFRGHKSGLAPDAVTAEVTPLWQRTDSGQAFRATLAQHGYELVQGNRRNFVLIDREGQEHSLARRISGVKAAEIHERLSDINPEELLQVGEGRSKRRTDKRYVQEAMLQGADKGRIERVINASRASDICPDGTNETMPDREGRDAYEGAVRRRAK